MKLLFLVVLLLSSCVKNSTVDIEIGKHSKVILIALDGIREEDAKSIKEIDLPEGYSSHFFGKQKGCKTSQKYNLSLPAYYTVFTGNVNPELRKNNYSGKVFHETFFDRYRRSIGFTSWCPLRNVASSVDNKYKLFVIKGSGFLETDNEVFTAFQNYYDGQEFAFVHFTDADDAAHSGSKNKYIQNSINEIKYTESIINSTAFKYGKDITYIVFTDHSRGLGHLWKYHGPTISNSSYMWVYIVSKKPYHFGKCDHISINRLVKELLIK